MTYGIPNVPAENPVTFFGLKATLNLPNLKNLYVDTTVLEPFKDHHVEDTDEAVFERFKSMDIKSLFLIKEEEASKDIESLALAAADYSLFFGLLERSPQGQQEMIKMFFPKIRNLYLFFIAKTKQEVDPMEMYHLLMVATQFDIVMKLHIFVIQVIDGKEDPWVPHRSSISFLEKGSTLISDIQVMKPKAPTE